MSGAENHPELGSGQHNRVLKIFPCGRGGPADKEGNRVGACPQADGSWRITQTTPGLPPQVYEVPAPASPPYSSGYTYPEAYAYPDFAPDWGWAGWGRAPWFFGLAPSIVVVQRFNHFHHGFHHGFAHGLENGVRGFGGHGFAAMHGGGIGGGHC
jgi:hypothetical protein